MYRNEIIITSIAFVIIIIILIWAYPQRKKASECAQELEGLKVETVEVKKKLEDCKKAKLILQNQLDSLMNQIEEKKNTKPRVKTRVQEKPAEATVILNVKVREQAEVSVARAPEPPKNDLIRTQKPVTRSVSTTSSAVPSYYYDQNGLIPFSVRLGGSENRHLPHLAIYDGIVAVDNDISGYNWAVVATKGIKGDWGFNETTMTFYVKASLIEKYLTSSDKGIIEIKAAATNWEPKQMTKSGDYYIYKK